MTGRRSEKAINALRTIGELAAETGIATHVLRYWERTVPALKPLRRSGGRRYYRAEDVALVRELHRLVSIEGYTLEGAARALGGARVGATQPAETEELPAAGAISLARLRALRDRLQSALDAS
jgi:DNA-binding transcriptional MerR regulator